MKNIKISEMDTRSYSNTVDSENVTSSQPTKFNDITVVVVLIVLFLIGFIVFGMIFVVYYLYSQNKILIPDNKMWDIEQTAEKVDENAEVEKQILEELRNSSAIESVKLQKVEVIQSTYYSQVNVLLKIDGKLEDPEIYHVSWDLCQKLSESVALQDMLNSGDSTDDQAVNDENSDKTTVADERANDVNVQLQFLFNSEKDSDTNLDGGYEEDYSDLYSCSKAQDWYKDTGSESYVLMFLSVAGDLEANQYITEYNTNLRAGNYSKMKDSALDLVDYRPSAVNYYNLGFAYYKLASLRDSNEMQNVNKAIEYYRKAIELDPEFAPPYSSLGYVLQLKNSPGSYVYTSEMKEMYDKAEELDPNWSFANMNRSLSLQNVFRFDDAYDAMKKAVEANPSFPDQAYIKDQYICLSRRTNNTESKDFYGKYGIDTKKSLEWCPW